ncbi:MAG: hypothetical protein GQ539_08020 [Sulfitobacter sp.]|nr:hypothetical protein [Sulfitobacter sp.]
MAMNDTVWARHANPWSGWSRVSVLPLLVLAAWSRIWIEWWTLIPVAAVLLWALLNPRVFPPPASIDNWMSKGVLGERLWISRSEGAVSAHHAPILRALSVAVALGSVMLVAGVIMLDLTLTMTGLSIAMLSKLWMLDRMVWIYMEAEEAKVSPAT